MGYLFYVDYPSSDKLWGLIALLFSVAFQVVMVPVCVLTLLHCIAVTSKGKGDGGRDDLWIEACNNTKETVRYDNPRKDTEQAA